jgi:hypothetical protein
LHKYSLMVADRMVTRPTPGLGDFDGLPLNIAFSQHFFWGGAAWIKINVNKNAYAVVQQKVETRLASVSSRQPEKLQPGIDHDCKGVVLNAVHGRETFGAPLRGLTLHVRRNKFCSARENFAR